jgi:hypothetical protein
MRQSQQTPGCGDKVSHNLIPSSNHRPSDYAVRRNLRALAPRTSCLMHLPILGWILDIYRGGVPTQSKLVATKFFGATLCWLVVSGQRLESCRRAASTLSVPTITIVLSVFAFCRQLGSQRNGRIMAAQEHTTTYPDTWYALLIERGFPSAAILSSANCFFQHTCVTSQFPQEGTPHRSGNGADSRDVGVWGRYLKQISERG